MPDDGGAAAAAAQATASAQAASAASAAQAARDEQKRREREQEQQQIAENLRLEREEQRAQKEKENLAPNANASQANNNKPKKKTPEPPQPHGSYHKHKKIIEEATIPGIEEYGSSKKNLSYLRGARRIVDQMAKDIFRHIDDGHLFSATQEMIELNRAISILDTEGQKHFEKLQKAIQDEYNAKWWKKPFKKQAELAAYKQYEKIHPMDFIPRGNIVRVAAIGTVIVGAAATMGTPMFPVGLAAMVFVALCLKHGGVHIPINCHGVRYNCPTFGIEDLTGLELKKLIRKFNNAHAEKVDITCLPTGMNISVPEKYRHEFMSMITKHQEQQTRPKQPEAPKDLPPKPPEKTQLGVKAGDKKRKQEELQLGVKAGETKRKQQELQLAVTANDNKTQPQGSNVNAAKRQRTEQMPSEVTHTEGPLVDAADTPSPTPRV